MMLAIFGLLGTLGGLAVVLVLLYRDSKLEKFYADSMQGATVECLGTAKGFVDVPTKVIVNTGHGWSILRAQVKRIIAAALRKGNVPEILVFASLSEDEQRAFLVEKGFSGILTIDILDSEFLESLIHYEAYKFIRGSKINDQIKAVSRKKFENARYRREVVLLDSLELGSDIVINPPPEEKPPLRDLILPIACAKQREIERVGKTIPEIELDKINMMILIDRIIKKECRVLFFGALSANEYISMLSDELNELKSFLLGARGKHIAFLKYASGKIFSDYLPVLWNREYESWSIGGLWEFPEGEKVDCLWHFCWR